MKLKPVRCFINLAREFLVIFLMIRLFTALSETFTHGAFTAKSHPATTLIR